MVGVEPTSIQLCANCFEDSANTCPLLINRELKNKNLAQLDNSQYLSYMEYNILSALVSQEKSISQMAIALDTSKTNIRYWLNKFNLKSKYRWKIEKRTTKNCPRCQIEKSIKEFYKRRNKAGASVYCKPCSNLEAIERFRRFKTLCVQYKGGKCVICGYNKSVSALDFHHINPKDKSFGIARTKSKKFDKKIKKELDKCNLLCANCHREEHFD